MTAPQPTLAGFITWVRTVMGVPSPVLPDNAPVLGMALAVSMAIVNPALRCVAIPQVDAAGVALNSGGLTIYVLAVYNLGGSNLLAYAQDAADAPIFEDKLPYWQFLRKKFNTFGFVSGVIQSTGDESTNSSLVVQDAAKNFTLANLQQLKDPWGRQYLAFAQSYGPSTWGIS
jgi:hypothetical protein